MTAEKIVEKYYKEELMQGINDYTLNNMWETYKQSPEYQKYVRLAEIAYEEGARDYSLLKKRSVYRRVKDFFRRGKTQKGNEEMFREALGNLMGPKS